jgi:arylsulfatase A-like enzyme
LPIDAAASQRAPEEPQRCNVVLIVADTVRADRLSCYGYARQTTPHIDAFAADSVRFTQAHATSSWTLPSHASLFTGLYPLRHAATQEHRRLDSRFHTLAEILSVAGYRTFAASGNPLVGPATQLDQGFDRQDFIETWRRRPIGDGGPPPAGHPATRAWQQFLQEHDSRQPFFAFFNIIEAHMPYAPPEPQLSAHLGDGVDKQEALTIGRLGWVKHYIERPYTRRTLQIMSQLYDGEVAYVDAIVGQLLETLAEHDPADQTLVIITSDHGEQFGTHGLVEHVFGLQRGAVHVPLLVRLPGGQRAGSVTARPAQSVDILPTILARCKLAAPAPHHGVDLLSEEPSQQREVVMSEYYWPAQVLGCLPRATLAASTSRLAPFLRRLRSIEQDGLRFVWGSDGRHACYDLSSDPAERLDLLASTALRSDCAALAERLEADVLRLSGGHGIPDVDPVSLLRGLMRHADPEVQAALRALGYVD